jgi:hypothetical protein
MDMEGWLRELRVPREAYRVVSLLPLVYVAWADRKLQEEFGADEEQLLLAWCQDVADAAGGLLGLKSARTDAENAALKTIAGALDVRNATQWRAALKA